MAGSTHPHFFKTNASCCAAAGVDPGVPEKVPRECVLEHEKAELDSENAALRKLGKLEQVSKIAQDLEFVERENSTMRPIIFERGTKASRSALVCRLAREIVLLKEELAQVRVGACRLLVTRAHGRETPTNGN